MSFNSNSLHFLVLIPGRSGSSSLPMPFTQLPAPELLGCSRPQEASGMPRSFLNARGAEQWDGAVSNLNECLDLDSGCLQRLSDLIGPYRSTYL